jgi:hypothetical protein
MCICIQLYNQVFRQETQVIQSHLKCFVQNIGQGKAWHKNCKKLKLRSDQAYNCSSD